LLIASLAAALITLSSLIPSFEPTAEARSSYYGAQCAGCHVTTPTTCNGCHPMRAKDKTEVKAGDHDEDDD
jgi:hypothetical protein